MKYAVLYETGPGGGYSATAPDLPGCLATGKTLEECRERMTEAIAFHIEGLLQEGLPIPPRTSEFEYVEVA